MFECKKCGKKYPDEVLVEHLSKHSEEIERIKKDAKDKASEEIEQIKKDAKDKTDEEVAKKLAEKLAESDKAKDNMIENLNKTVEELNKTLENEKIKRERDQKNFETAMKKSQHISPEIQGEAQERLIEEILKNEFRNDLIEPVPRGVEGGDCIQNIKEPILKNLVPKILFESKDTGSFDKKWISKLAKNMAQAGAAKGVLITKALPKGFVGCETFIQNKIWVIPYKKDIIIALVSALRNMLVEVAIKHNLSTKSPEHIKKVYDYCMSDEFALKVQKNIDDLLKLKEMFESIQTYVENKVKEAGKTIDDMTDNVKAIDDRFKSFNKLIDDKN
tara:strand:- start:35 stop:1030 length:996 start_codon:yes stop_codon:yes gene_type:complete